ncbi:IPT/TIG domain-containing protein [Nitrosopumilus ureiphilus]|uniref:IPT/TIG domain-containing protein n=1 Tax=Nitrosopumilus ureiphilus TaxID=1470067 RepID=UPI0015CA049E|nr:IPT/TIG domain-containing protein [Nitrosopumilus ureiphilus]
MLKSNTDIASTDRIVIAFVISFLVVVLIVFVARAVLKRGDKKASFLDILRDRDWYPSLAILQFFAWTMVIIFAFFGVYLIRVFHGISEPPTEIPLSLLALMGISVAVPVVSGGVSSIKYKTTDSKKVKETGKGARFSSMLQEKGKPTLTRFQMFGWTWIGIVIYLIILFSNVSDTANNGNFEELILPDIDPTLVVLMGMSQGAYLGGKIVTKQEIEITGIFPSNQKANASIVITGSNFGNTQGFVRFGDNVISAGKINSWDNSKIEVTIPVGTPSGKHQVQVGVEGTLTDEKEYETT